MLPLHVCTICTTKGGVRPVLGSVGDRYRIERPIGSGGMGVVYQALDLVLNRPVAIKALDDRHALNDEAVARLRSEALAAASLDHPYICKVYELISAGSQTFIVMEFIEGETLDAKLRRGALSVLDTLRLGCEIAEGLAVAHGRGIVHRDIKPSNVMVTPHGHVKLLDFGLAQRDAASGPDATTRPADRTDGSGAGTPSHMSPEQARGGAITARVDVFAFGVVLFECLTGELPFEGLNVDEYLAGVASRAPKDLHHLVPGVPADLSDLLSRCLDKNPARRPASAAVLVRELRRLEGLESGRPPGPADRGVGSSRRWLFALGVATVIAIPAVLVVRSRLTPRPDDVEREWPIVSWPSDESGSRLSPDGHWVTFLSTRDGPPALFLQSTDGGEPRPLALGAGDIVSHVWAPDNQRLACVRRIQGRVLVQVIPAFSAGAPTASIVVEPPPFSVRAVRWIGTKIYLDISDQANDQLVQIDLNSGTVTDLTRNWHAPGHVKSFDIRADGLQVAFVERDPSHGAGREDLWLADLDGTHRVRLTDDEFSKRSPVWVGRGRAIVYQSDRSGPLSLWEISPRGHTSWPFPSQAIAEAESSSLDGGFVSFRQVSSTADLWRFDAAGRGGPVTESGLSDFSPSVSGDGRLIAFARSREDASQPSFLDAHILTGAIDAGGGRVVTIDRGAGVGGELSPDGHWLAYFEVVPAAREWRLRVKNLSTDEIIAVSDHAPLPAYFTFPLAFPFEWTNRNFVWSGDGQTLFFVENRPVSQLRQYHVGVGVDNAPLASWPFIVDLCQSADRVRIAYLTRTGSDYTLRVRRLMDSAEQSVPLSGQTPSTFLLGWTRGDAALVVARSGATEPDASSPVTVSTVTLSGRITPVGTLMHAFVATARLDAARAAVYATVTGPSGRNIHELLLAGGAERPITDNRSPALGFSRAVPVGDGTLIVAREEQKRDVWLVKLK
jgi:serine/threonine protein kinase